MTGDKQDIVYHFNLFIAGMSPNSFRAIENIKDICEQYLQYPYELEIIDIYQQPLLAKENDLLATPTLIRTHPLPRKVIVGDLSETEKVLNTLEITYKKR